MPSSPSPLGVYAAGRYVSVTLFVPLPELGYAHCAEPTGGTRPGGTCQPVSLSLSRSRVRAGSARPCASAPDRGSGQGQSWPARLWPLVSVAAGPLSRPRRVTSGRTRTMPPWARSWSPACGRRMFCELGHGPVTRLAAAVRRGRGLVPLQVRFAGPPPYLHLLPAAPFLFRCTPIAFALHSMLLTPLRKAQAIRGLLSSPSAAASAAEPLNPTLGLPGRPAGPGSGLAGDVPVLLSLWALR